jgi:hypothetical protein
MAIGTSGVSVPSIGQSIDTSIYGNKEAPKGMSLSDIVDLSRSSTALQKEKALLEPQIRAGKAAAETAETQASKSKLGLATDFADKMRQNQISLINDPLIVQAEQDPQFAAANKDKIAKLVERQAKAATEMGLDPTKAAELNAPYLEAVNQTNGQGLRQFLKTRMLAGLDTQAQTALQQPSTNALGQTVITNPIQETRKTLGESNPTTPGVANFNQYQQDLTNRVAGATQVEMRINEAENLMKEFKPGAGSRTYVDIAQKLQAVGAPQSLVDSVAKGDLSAAQSLNKFIAQTVTANIGQMQGNPTANMMNDYLKNNPDISSDPRALQRFFEFGHKQNAIPIEEQQFLLEKAKKGNLNPDTHVAESQQHILEKFAQKQNTVTGKERGNATFGKYKGRDVVSYDGGKSWEYK